MKNSLGYMLGTTAVAALLLVAACDQNEEEKAAQQQQPGEVTETVTPPPALDEVTPPPVPRTNDVSGGMNDMSMAEERAAEGTDAETITGMDEDFGKACAAAADLLGTSAVGQPYDDVKEAIEAKEGIDRVRVIRPGDAVTRDLRLDRLNVELDGDDKVTRIYCG